ncbi:hypothetical protein OMAG_000028, partial [Candidatus Omnitrophus magneticus]
VVIRERKMGSVRGWCLAIAIALSKGLRGRLDRWTRRKKGGEGEGREKRERGGRGGKKRRRKKEEKGERKRGNVEWFGYKVVKEEGK